MGAWLWLGLSLKMISLHEEKSLCNVISLDMFKCHRYACFRRWRKQAYAVDQQIVCIKRNTMLNVSKLPKVNGRTISVVRPKPHNQRLTTLMNFRLKTV